MGQRLDLHKILVQILGSTNVYFQPPATVSMNYPAIVYKREAIDIVHADNHPYQKQKRYLVTVIDRNPDSDIPDKVAELRTARHERSYTSNNLNHDVFSIYF